MALPTTLEPEVVAPKAPTLSAILTDVELNHELKKVTEQLQGGDGE